MFPLICSVSRLGYSRLNHVCIFSSPSIKCLSYRQAHSGHTEQSYDVIVVGGGHAGTEAACAAARMGANTLLLTHKLSTVGEMSCNPSFGGIGKGHLMREVDALGGVCARICDISGVQYKVLNRRKGPAVWGPRAQIDRVLYKQNLQKEVFSTPNLTVRAAAVEDLIIGAVDARQGHGTTSGCKGVVLASGDTISSQTVVLTAGTFLRGCINIGLSVTPAGRIGDEPAIGLAKTIEDAGFKLGRLKTGTPPRLDKRTIDFSRTGINFGDSKPSPFSFMNETVWIKPEDQLPCHMTRTTDKVAEIVHASMHLNRHVQEEINGPRYCPSIESKILRFGPRTHQIWLEPEGLDSEVIYPQGMSVTMPEEFQVKMMRSIPGLEEVELVRPGYGVEYDYSDPRQLCPTLETIPVRRLFMAGQINGTTGYEEAAAQGIIAGINAACLAQDKPALTVGRSEGYIGVLIDDLTTQGTSEPYRMFTSRAEFRLSLRPDNADLRLTHKGYAVGCVSEERQRQTERMRADLADNLDLLQQTRKSSSAWRRELHLRHTRDTGTMSAVDFLGNPEVSLDDLVATFPEFNHLKDASRQLKERLEIEIKYSYEIQQQQEAIEQVKREEQMILPDDLDYFSLNMSNDAKSKLAEARPASIAAASRIPGMTPAAIVILLNHVKSSSRPKPSAHSHH